MPRLLTVRAVEIRIESVKRGTEQTCPALLIRTSKELLQEKDAHAYHRPSP